MADIVTKHLSHEPVAGFPHHADTISSDREPYGPAGLRGLVASPFVLLCTACSTLGGLLFGYDQGVVSVMLVMDQFVIEFPRFDESHPRSGVAKGLLTAMIELGASVGALNQGWIANKISRRYSVLLAVAIFTVGSVLQTAVYGTRYMAGEWAWRLTFLIQMIPGFILAAGVYILPFSPRWLASKGRGKEALESLCRLRSLPVTDRRIRQELMDIQVEVRFCQEKNTGRHPRLQAGGVKDSILQELSSWANCFLKGCWRRTHVGIGLGFFQQVSYS